VFERLVEWAAAALETSSNQPVLPHAIIVLNASENNVAPELWDVDVATERLLESLSHTVHQNVCFKKHAQLWGDRNRQIETVEQLMLSYYSSLRVSIRSSAQLNPLLVSYCSICDMVSLITCPDPRLCVSLLKVDPS
jgi:hypothetical protein